MTAASTTVPLLEARALSFHRQDEPVFAPLDFRLHAGELALVEGDNGSGKTTLLRMLAGLLHRSAGELLWRGEALQRDQCAGEILFLGHQLGLKADLSPRENLRIAVGLHGAREGLSVASVLADIGLRGYEDEPVRRLSAGQKKRAALARLVLLPAIGVGSGGWSEPSLFAIGPDLAVFDQLATAHGQLAYVHGQATGPALLRTLA